MANKNLAYINKDMLVWARSETPFANSPDQLLLRFPRISLESLKKWESGEDKNSGKIYVKYLNYKSFYDIIIHVRAKPQFAENNYSSGGRISPMAR